VKKQGDGLAGGRCDFVGVAFDLDDMGLMGLAGDAQREVQNQQGRLGNGAESGGALEDLFYSGLDGRFAGGAQDLAVLALDLHPDDLVGVLPGFVLLVSHEGDEASVEGSETRLVASAGGSRRLKSRRDSACDFNLKVAL